MKIIHYSEAEAKKYPSEQAKNAIGRVVIGQGDGAKRFCMRVFEIGRDGMTGKHAHEWEHEIFVHAGVGDVLNNGRWNPVKPGNVLFIPGNEEHQIRNSGAEIFVFVCLVPSTAPEL